MISRDRGRSSQLVRRVAIAVLVMLGVGSVSTTVGVGAQDNSDVVKGGANASADSIATVINNAGAALGWTFGRSTAAYRDITATSEGKAVDLGALEALLSQPQCNGTKPPALNVATIPPKTIADSTVSGSEVAKTLEVNQPRFAQDTSKDKLVGSQTASATKTPSSSSTTAMLNQDFGAFKVEGATSEAHTSFENGIRMAEASTTAKRVIVLGGQVVFYQPVWKAKAWSGADSGEEASFTFQSAYVFGNWVKGTNLERDLALFRSIVEGLLSPLGVKISFPKVTEPFSGDGISISPISFSLSNAPIAYDLLIPLLGSDLMQDYRTKSVERDCTTETIWTIIDAAERALGGSGSIQILVGGATATTDATDYSFKPIEEPPTTVAAPEPTTVAADVPVEVSNQDDLGTGYTDDFGTGYTDDLGTGYTDDLGSDYSGDLAVVEDPIPIDTVPSETGDVTGDLTDGREIAAGDTAGGSAGNTAAIVVGVLALLGAIGLSLGDRVMGMRAGRRIP